MSAYDPSSGLTYPQYLQAQSFVDDVKLEVSTSALKVVASVNDLKEYHIVADAKASKATQELKHEVIALQDSINEGSRAIIDRITKSNETLDRIDDTLHDGFIELHWDLYSINSSIQDLSAKFDWGFSEFLLRLGSLDDSLETLIRLAKTPEQTWAYEQFDIARDAFRKRLYSEALEHLERAISGYQAHTGYKLEHRFHYLQGTIYLGGYQNSSPDIVDLDKAEQCFFKAYRYSEMDLKKEAARACCAAGFAAYCQSRFEDAERHTKRAIELNPNLPEAQYQMAEVNLVQGNQAEGMKFIEKALRLDPLYSLKCLSNPIFKKHETAILAVVDGLRKEYTRECSVLFGTMNRFREALLRI